jgi:hypothetical protein
MVHLADLLPQTKLSQAEARAMHRFAGLGSLTGSEEDGQVTPTAAVLLLVGDHLLRQNYSTPQVYAILAEIREPTQDYVEDRWQTDLDEVWAIQLIDGIYLAWPRCARPYDFDEGVWAHALPREPIHSSALSITGLLNRVVTPLLQP